MPRYAPSERLHAVQALVARASGASAYDVMEVLRCSRNSAMNYLRAVGDRQPLDSEMVEGKKVFRLRVERSHAMRFTVAQVFWLFFLRAFARRFAGTGIDEDLEKVYETMEATLKRSQLDRVAELGRKVYHLPEHPRIYEGKSDHVDEIVTAIVDQKRLRVTHASAPGRRRRFEFDPYTLVVYKDGLYVAGHSHHHAGIRTLALDGFAEVERTKERFEFPEGYHPAALYEGCFGMIGGEPTRVRVRFDAGLAAYVRRRQWHASQKLIELPGGGVELRMRVRGTVELESWVLGFGGAAEVLEPPTLRERILAAAQAIARRYQPEAD